MWQIYHCRHAQRDDRGHRDVMYTPPQTGMLTRWSRWWFIGSFGVRIECLIHESDRRDHATCAHPLLHLFE
jgi:hypothetical protein